MEWRSQGVLGFTMVMQEYLVWIGIYTVGAAMLISGIAAYRGKWRRWVRHMMAYEMGKHPQFGFLMLYAGLAVVFGASAGVAGSLRAPNFLGIGFQALAGLSILLCIAAVTRLPRPLLPAWYRRWIDNGAVKEDILHTGGDPVTTWVRKRAGR